MTKQEFLSSLQETLAEELNGQQVAEQIRYYNSYIDEQTAGGRPETEVLEELGDARMIARNIIDGLEQEGYSYKDRTQTFSDGNGNVYERTRMTYTNEDGSGDGWKTKLKVYGCLGFALVALFVVIALVTRLIIWLLPSVIVIVLLVWIFKQFDRR